MGNRLLKQFNSNLKPFLPFSNYLLGIDKPITYLILLGNDTEVRANAGFAGSYAKLTLSQSSNPQRKHIFCYLKPELCNLKLEFSFHDIYVPNGQLEGYVAPPEAIQQAFGLGSWYLANADFEPHFPTAANSIRWFLEKGKEANPDILVTLNLSTIKEVLKLVEDIKLSENNTVITPDNLYLYLQGKAELNFFPGSTQKADALHSVGTATIKKINSQSLNKKIKIAQILLSDLKNQNIVLHSSNPNFQTFLVNQKLAGEYKNLGSFDHYGLVELNLGANKANAYVTRNTSHSVFQENNQIKHNSKVTLTNSSPEGNPNPPLHYGGNYIAYLRFYIPQNATSIDLNHSIVSTTSAINQKITDNQEPVIGNCEECNLKTISFWHITLAGATSEIDLSYTLPNIEPKNYTLTLLKQNGFRSSPQVLNIFGQEQKDPLARTFTYQVPKSGKI